MEINAETISINGREYVPKETAQASMAVNTEGKPYAIVRTYSAGCFAGYINTENGKEVELLNARRLWYWEGAASLSQLAVDGTSKPTSCKFPCETPVHRVKEAIEVIPCTDKAKASIQAVPVWKE